MRKFLIKDDNVISETNEYASLSYDEDMDEYHVSIPSSVNPDDLPAILGLLARKGIREIEDKWARRFVRERVVPPDRQNIGMILRDAGMGYYSEFLLLVYTSGRCAMDEFYIEEIE
ncbi:MAG: hypothetical protein K2G55_00635 [Lachnospiraceae bacterium]|nr:hypothetical protein [Lachnospiraceae bacterium]MDE7201655.1 hypothetical protein [Lachnospiraceae bacterium]